MKRRGFLKALAGFLAAPLAPLSKLAGKPPVNPDVFLPSAGAATGINAAWGLPDSIYGIPVVVDNAVKTVFGPDCGGYVLSELPPAPSCLRPFIALVEDEDGILRLSEERAPDKQVRLLPSSQTVYLTQDAIAELERQYGTA